ncbi:MAG: agmatinase [Solirubrobacterales bacterium]|nr:agmatinase [Solirubrobacterales bacterium]
MSEPRGEPRFTGIHTFAGAPHVPLERVAEHAAPTCAVVGVPFDTATSWRAGARFGPEAIRSASAMLRPWHPVHRVEVLGARGGPGARGGLDAPREPGARGGPGEARVLDCGDVAIVPGNAARSLQRIDAALAPLCARGTPTLALGGDHTILLGELRAQARAGGPVALVALDAHADTWDEYYGERLFHGTVLRRGVEEGVLDPAHSLIAGLRGSLYGESDLEEARALGFELIAIEGLRAGGAAAFGERVRERTDGRARFLSFDIDVVDPSAAPGTGTPEIGGLHTEEALALLRALAGLRFRGFDVVELSPPYDGPGQITALLAAGIAYELAALAALAPASSAGAP